MGYVSKSLAQVTSRRAGLPLIVCGGPRPGSGLAAVACRGAPGPCEANTLRGDRGPC